MRLAVNKTYKMLIGGAFVRSESNRSLETDGVNTPRGTRKDVKDAVKAARAAQPGWDKKTAYNRGQILYRLAEMLEARTDEFVKLGCSESEVAKAVDALVYYAGWADKYQQILGSVNPVAAPYFNFSMPEALGVVGVIVEGETLFDLVSQTACVIVSGNTVVTVSDDAGAVVACEFGEIVATSDVPAGVVNILTGRQEEMLPHLARHMDVNGLCASPTQIGRVLDDATENLKRLRSARPGQGLAQIEDFVEIKTVWHPVGL